MASPVTLLKWVILAYLFCISMSLETPVQNCHPHDLLALKEFAGNLTNGSILSAWSNEPNCCKWGGIVCGNGSAESRVIKINLSRKGLRGVISRSLENLDQLKLLDLSHNRLEGGLLFDLSKLKQLEVLDLSHNVLLGPVLRSLDGLELIHSINISSNFFTGNFSEFGEFPDLVALNVSNNTFTGGFKFEICSVSKKIKVLDLSLNHLTGDLGGLGNCNSSLQQLHIDSNKFGGGLPDSLYSMTSLEDLSLSANDFSGLLSPQLSKLSKLKSLVLSGNHFYGLLPNVFGNLTQLEHLCVESNRFSGPLPSTLSYLAKLRVLDLKNNSFFGRVDLDFTRLSSLCTVDLASNRFFGHLPASLSNCQELKVLNLAKNEFNGTIPENYANLSSLVFLSASKNSLSNLSGALSVLQHCRNLSTLILSKNFHGEEIPENVSKLVNLKVFGLGNCGLDGKFPMWLYNCSKLQVLDLSMNHLDGNIPPWIGEFENLFYLDLSNNSLIGEIPKSLTALKSLISPQSYASSLNTPTGIPLIIKKNPSASALQYSQASSFPPTINLSYNRLNGTIWPEIGRLKQLHALDLSKNNITGIIPSSISNMTNLETLELSSNDLHGSIPDSFNKLTFLSKFNVANNHLQGAIPTGGQFFSFPSSSFEGNPGLCGKIISPCTVSNLGIRPTIPSAHSSKKLGRGGIFGITISIGIGVALLLAIVLLKISKRDAGHQIEDFEEDIIRPHRLSDAFGPSKLVLFQNCDCKELTVEALLKSTNNFSQSNIVGCGGFGLVYKAELPNGTKTAIKRLSGDCGQMEREFQAEVEALSRAQHNNLVPLQGYCRHGSDRLLIYSYMENGSLDYWLHERVDGSSLTWDVRLKTAQGAARGLAYLHKEPNIVHRDIKTSNILLNEKFEAHLADFGLSRLLHPYDTHVTTDLVGTLGYIPPEYSQTLTATFRGDVYSYGVVLLELLTGKRPVEVCRGKSCRDLVSWVFRLKSENRTEEIFDTSIWDASYEKQLLEVLGIACRCIDHDPRQRPSIDQVVTWLEAIGNEKAR